MSKHERMWVWQRISRERKRTRPVSEVFFFFFKKKKGEQLPLLRNVWLFFIEHVCPEEKGLLLSYLHVRWGR